MHLCVCMCVCVCVVLCVSVCCEGRETEDSDRDKNPQGHKCTHLHTCVYREREVGEGEKVCMCM